MGKLTQFTIQMDTGQPVYYPGQTLSGIVTVGLSDSMDMRSMKLKLKGKGSCHWTEEETRGDGDDQHTETVHYKGKETIVKMVHILFGDNSSSDPVTHPAGVYNYPFSFVLPSGMPSSFEGNHGYIRYLLKATIDKPWKFDHKVKRPIVINDIIDTNNPMYATGPGGETHKDVGCLCCLAGPLDLNASIDRSCYCPGEAILINSSVRNATSRDMDSLHAKLIQTVTYHSSRKSRTWSKDVAKLYGPKIPKGEDANWINQPFGIPALPPTITNSKIITVHYKLKVIVDLPWGFDPVIKMHITMGTVPYMKVYGQPIQYGTPEDQQSAPEANFMASLAYPPPQPSVFGYPDMPPPSYSAAVGETGVNIARDGKDQYTYGDMNYNPVYTFAQPYQGTYTGPSAPPPHPNAETVYVAEGGNIS